MVWIEERREDYQDGRKIFRVKPVFLRLNPDNYRQNLMNFMTLRNFYKGGHMSKPIQNRIFSVKETLMTMQPTIIDLRIAHLAFVKNGYNSE